MIFLGKEINKDSSICAWECVYNENILWLYAYANFILQNKKILYIYFSYAMIFLFIHGLNLY